MGTLRIMSRNGDDRVSWDATLLEEGDPAAVAAVEEAEQLFREQRRRGAVAFRIDKQRGNVRIETFDPQVEQIILVPPLIGG